jgi:hypothetical protein
LKKFFIGIVIIISGILFLMLTNNNNFKEIEDLIVIAYSFIFFGIIYCFLKLFECVNF